MWRSIATKIFESVEQFCITINLPDFAQPSEVCPWHFRWVTRVSQSRKTNTIQIESVKIKNKLETYIANIIRVKIS